MKYADVHRITKIRLEKQYKDSNDCFGKMLPAGDTCQVCQDKHYCDYFFKRHISKSNKDKHEIHKAEHDLHAAPVEQFRIPKKKVKKAKQYKEPHELQKKKNISKYGFDKKGIRNYIFKLLIAGRFTDGQIILKVYHKYYKKSEEAYRTAMRYYHTFLYRIRTSSQYIASRSAIIHRNNDGLIRIKSWKPRVGQTDPDAGVNYSILSEVSDVQRGRGKTYLGKEIPTEWL